MNDENNQPVPQPPVIPPTEPVVDPAPVQPAAPVTPSIQPDPFATDVPQPGLPQNSGTPKSKKKTFIIIGIAIAGVLVLLGVIFGGWFAYATSAAASYQKSMKAVVENNEDLTSLTATNVSDIDSLDDAIVALTEFQQSKPTLKSVPLGSLVSPHYKRADKAQADLNAGLNGVITNFEGIKEFVAMTDALKAQQAQLVAVAKQISASGTTLNVSASITQLKTLTAQVEAVPANETNKKVKDIYVDYLKTLTAELEKIQKNPTAETAQASSKAIVTASTKFAIDARKATTEVSDTYTDNLNTAVDQIQAAQAELNK